MKEIFSERLVTLRKGMKMSQAKLANLVGATQSSINRYERQVGLPPHEILLWYADYFDVSMDYIYGRTIHPQGKNYDCVPKKVKDDKELKQFVEMCFDPNSPLNEKLKETLLQMLSERSK